MMKWISFKEQEPAEGQVIIVAYEPALLIDSNREADFNRVCRVAIYSYTKQFKGARIVTDNLEGALIPYGWIPSPEAYEDEE